MSQPSDVNAKQQCEKLMNSLLPTAQSMLSKYREFYPYGGYIELDGQIQHVGVKDETTEYPESEDMIDALENLFLGKARAHECKATAIVCDVRVKDSDGGRKRDAIHVRLDHEDGYSTEVFFPYEIVKDKIHYGEAFEYAGKGAIFRHYRA
jgi:hypothetical protein